MNSAVSMIVTILLAIIGVAIVSVLVSKQAQTSSVIGAVAKGFSQVIGSAVSPVSGGMTGSVGTLTSF
jgi:hypothetical protein